LAAGPARGRQCRRRDYSVPARRLDDTLLATGLVAEAAERPRWGDRRLRTLLRRDGWVVNLKRVLRVYRALGLRLRKRAGRKQVSTVRVPRPVAVGPNAQWTLDFISDAFASGRKFRVLSVVDECTRECLALRADVSQPSWKVVAVLDELASSRGRPQRLIIDNGPEFVAKALNAWAYALGVELFFTRRGKPVDNCYIESFHDKFRDECLSTHWFLGLSDARRVIEAWQENYNTVRPHSALGGRTPQQYREMLDQNHELESALSIPA
jgi:putative transposase